MAYKEIQLSEIGLCDIDGTYYHQTHRGAADYILRNGFTVFHEGNQRFSDGCYFLSYTGASYGDVTLSAHISGVFVDFSNDHYLSAWNEATSKYMHGSYTTLANNLQLAYPGAVGLNFGKTLVVWDVSHIDNIQDITNQLKEGGDARFESFIGRLRNGENDSLIESILSGYRAIYKRHI